MVDPTPTRLDDLRRRIRLTGLLRKTLATAGVFYMAFRRGTTTVAAAQETGAVSTEPLDAGARPFAFGAVPASVHIARARVPARLGDLKVAEGVIAARAAIAWLLLIVRKDGAVLDVGQCRGHVVGVDCGREP